MERRHCRVPLPSEEGPRSLTSGRRDGFVCQDPRQFKFAIICKRCDLKYATMQEARAHFQECPFGKSIDVMCGHCEMRTLLWSAMCAHLNQPGMQKQVACRPEYRMTPPQRAEFPRVTQLMQPPASPLALTELSRPDDVQPGVGGWREPIPLTLSPSRQEARGQRHAQLRSTLLHWGRKHPSRRDARGWTEGAHHPSGVYSRPWVPHAGCRRGRCQRSDPRKPSSARSLLTPSGG